MRTLRVTKTPQSAAIVRTSIAADLLAAGFSGDLADDAALLASELVSNAVRHGTALPSGQLEVGWAIDDSGVRVQVTDGGGPNRPALRRAGSADVSGRGLTIVAALADDWGVDERPGTTTVWAHLTAHPTPANS